MLKDVVWPAVWGTTGLWFQQDGARVHTTNDVLDFLQEKFHGQVNLNQLKLSWSVKSLDLNPMDFYFWGAAEAEVFQ